MAGALRVAILANMTSRSDASDMRHNTMKAKLAAGKTPGMPATSNSIDYVRSKGVRYIYTHLPKLLKAGSEEFLRAAGR